MRFTVKGNLDLLRDLEIHITEELEQVWYDIIRQFLEEVLEEVPVITGATKQSFASLAGLFGASVDLGGPTHAYEIWKGWEHKHGQWRTNVTHAAATGKDGFAYFELYNIPKTFAWNDYASTAYRQYWKKGAPVWPARESGTQEPWGALLEAKATMLSRLRKEIPIALGTALQKAIFTGRRRR